MSTDPNFIDESLVSTPKPTATSTITKKLQKDVKGGKKQVMIPFNLSVADSSLGILHSGCEEGLVNNTTGIDLIHKLRTERQLAQSLLERASTASGLPSKYLKAETIKTDATSYYPENSTVSESDLVTQKESVNSRSFYPNNVSTPRNSDALERSSMFHDISDMSAKIRNSNISLQDACSELNKVSFGGISNARVSGVDSQMFTPAELMTEKLKKDEMSWRRERDFPYEKLRDSFASISGIGKPSVGAFFQTRTNDLGDILKAKSPEKLQPPFPLVDLTNLTSGDVEELSRKSTIQVENNEQSLISVTQIAKALSALSSDSPKKIADLLLNKKKIETATKRTSTAPGKRSVSPANIENIPPKSTNLKLVKENDCDDYIAKKQSASTQSTLAMPSIFESTHLPTRSSTKSESELRLPTYENMYPQAQSSMKKSPDIQKENKETMSDYGSLGSRCPSSLDSIPEGKLPIKGNKLEIVWGCVKIGRNSTQSCCIRNQLNQKIRMQVSVTGSNFRIVKERGETENSMIFILHPLETKSLSITFYPLSIGAVYEKLNFYPISNGDVVQHLQQTIRLFGYGGHSSAEIINLAKDSAGRFWLPLGPLEYKPVITQQFTIKNNGVLAAFTMLELSDCLSNVSKININPTEIVIRPKEEVKVTITYNPRRQDYNSQLEIIDVGSIKIITGAEVTRGRLRRLHKLLSQRAEPIDSLITKLSKKFPNENIPGDVSILTESPSIVVELLQQLNIKEIRLTVERDLDSTLVGPMADFENTTMYQTLYQDSVFPGGTETKQKSHKNLFTVEPSSILFSLPYKKEDTVLLQSNSSSTTNYKIEVTDGFVVSPSSGSILNGGVVVVHVKCIKAPSAGTGKITICVGGEVCEVIIKAISVRQT